MESQVSRQRGFTQIEIMIVTVIIAVLASVAISSYRDYSRRATISEVVLAATPCKNAISEGYITLLDAPDAGKWGCEQAVSSNKQKHVGYVQTSSDGVVRVSITGLDSLVNNRHIYLVPLRFDGENALVMPDDLGRNVTKWACGSDWMPVRNALPSSCRADTTIYAGQDFQ